MASLIVASRPGQHLDDLTAALPHGITLEAAGEGSAAGPAKPVAGIEVRTYQLHDADGHTSHFYLLPGLNVEISASAIRSQVQSASDNQPAGQELLPAPVAEYIRSHGLYR